MSFILDALKKSEGERQRQTGPTLFQAKLAPPKSRLPMWAILIGALLAVNLSVVGWLLWRNATKPETSPPTASSAGAPQAPGSVGQPASAASSQQVPNTPPPIARRSTIPDVASDEPEEPVLDEEEAEEAAGLNPEDYEPAMEGPPPARATARPENSGVVRSTASGLPTYDDAKASGGNIPELRLDLHVYSPTPEKRFVFLNMKKLLEGQSLPEGVRVETITPTGVELSFQGRKFVLTRD